MPDMTDEEEIELEMERQEAATEQDLFDRIADAFDRADKGAEVEAVWPVVEAELALRAEQAEAERDALKAELERLRRQIVDDEVDLDDVMASLHQPTGEVECGRCGGTRIEPGSEDYDAVAHRDNPYTGEPCSACHPGDQTARTAERDAEMETR